MGYWADLRAGSQVQSLVLIAATAFVLQKAKLPRNPASNYFPTPFGLIRPSQE